MTFLGQSSPRAHRARGDRCIGARTRLKIDVTNPRIGALYLFAGMRLIDAFALQIRLQGVLYDKVNESPPSQTSAYPVFIPIANMKSAVSTAALAATLAAAPALASSLYGESPDNHTCVLVPDYLSCSAMASPNRTDSCCVETFGGLVLATQVWRCLKRHHR